MMHCSDCGRDFGGTDAYERHLERRKDRCRTDRELHRRDLYRDADGVWHRHIYLKTAARRSPRRSGLGFDARGTLRALLQNGVLADPPRFYGVSGGKA